jgi:hypothetical protein
MELDIRVEPYNLYIKDITVVICPCCDMILQRNIRTENYKNCAIPTQHVDCCKKLKILAKYKKFKGYSKY